MFSSSHSIPRIGFVDTSFGTGDHGVIGEHRRYGGVGGGWVRGWKGDNSPMRVSSLCTNGVVGRRWLDVISLVWKKWWGEYRCGRGRDQCLAIG